MQTAGDKTYQVLHDHKFAYDSSMVTKLSDGLWPYTLDHKIPNCIIRPCPESEYFVYYNTQIGDFQFLLPKYSEQPIRFLKISLTI